MNYECAWHINRGIPCVHILKVLEHEGIMDANHMNTYVNPLYSIDTLRHLLRDLMVFDYAGHRNSDIIHFSEP